MSISRWDPFGDIVSLREAMNNLLEDSFVRPRPGQGETVSGLALDVRETADAFIVTASVPGVAPADVDITVLGDTLQIRGERREERSEGSDQEGRWLVRERRFGAFQRGVSLPTAVKADAANAEFKDGVLTVTLPKADQAKPRTIPVRTSSGSSQAQEIEVGGGSKGGSA